ncbi:MAG: hypothetical protein GY853_09920 [PVC group bacterium]|nr:hypothetical protein [PVC group bacterium]
MRIQYLYTEGKEGDDLLPLRVKLDGKIVGVIKKVKEGYSYFPKGLKDGGEIFNSITEVQNSLEFEEHQNELFK